MKALLLSVCLLLGLGLVSCENSQAQENPPTNKGSTVVTDTSQTSAGMTDNLALIDAAGLDFAEKRVIDVYNQVSPSVVSVTTQIVQHTVFMDAYTQEGAGSGFVLDSNGHILTNYHVIQGAQQDSIEVTFGDNTTLPAKLVGVDSRNDVAVLQVDASSDVLKPVTLGESDTLQVGQRAIAIGNPFGEFSRTLTTGVISALNRTIQGPDNVDITGIIQTDASINKGNSGGPLLDSAGRVIGINSAIFSPTGTSAGVGFAVPIDTIKRVLPDLLELGYYRRPWLGLDSQSAYRLSPGLARALNLPVEQGLLMVQVDGPLKDAGIRGAQQRVLLGGNIAYIGGDILTAINGQPITDFNSLATLLETQFKVGDEVTITIMRDNKEQTYTLNLVQQPVNQ